jgi:hypothetical protein
VQAQLDSAKSKFQQVLTGWQRRDVAAPAQWSANAKQRR